MEGGSHVRKQCWAMPWTTYICDTWSLGLRYKASSAQIRLLGYWKLRDIAGVAESLSCTQQKAIWGKWIFQFTGLFTEVLEVFWQKTSSRQHTFPVQFAGIPMTAEIACGRQPWIRI